jgi:hypothetical protein
METVDNAFLVGAPGASNAGLADALFWASLLASLAVAFVATVPVNRVLIARGNGHAVVHQFNSGVEPSVGLATHDQPWSPLGERCADGLATTPDPTFQEM